jgi:hypothetical protein
MGYLQEMIPEMAVLLPSQGLQQGEEGPPVVRGQLVDFVQHIRVHAAACTRPETMRPGIAPI